jgi:phosphoketolase
MNKTRTKSRRIRARPQQNSPPPAALRCLWTASLDADLLRKMDAWWRAANYLSVGQTYLYDNPLLKQPLKREHVKPRLVGHWGTTPGLNFIYVHLNRVIKARDVNMIYLIGPGHGGPGIVANTWLEGTYSEVYVIDRLPQLGSPAAYAKQAIRNALIEHRQYINERGEDHPFVLGWKWGEKGPVSRRSSTEADNV